MRCVQRIWFKVLLLGTLSEMTDNKIREAEKVRRELDNARDLLRHERRSSKQFRPLVIFGNLGFLAVVIPSSIGFGSVEVFLGVAVAIMCLLPLVMINYSLWRKSRIPQLKKRVRVKQKQLLDLRPHVGNAQHGLSKPELGAEDQEGSLSVADGGKLSAPD